MGSEQALLPRTLRQDFLKLASSKVGFSYSVPFQQHFLLYHLVFNSDERY